MAILNLNIGRIAGQWEYRSTPQYVAANLLNVRPCIWFEHPTFPYAVPWKRGMTLQRAADTDAVRDNADLYYHLAPIREYALTNATVTRQTDPVSAPACVSDDNRGRRSRRSFPSPTLDVRTGYFVSTSPLRPADPSEDQQSA